MSDEGRRLRQLIASMPSGGGGGGAVTSVNGYTGSVVLAKADVGLGSVDNTADAAKVVLSASKLTTARNISISGDGNWTVSFDGSGSMSSGLTLATVNATTGTFGGAATVPQFSVNGKGLVTGVTAVAISIPFSQLTSVPTTLAGHNITLTSGNVTTALGFTPAPIASPTFTGVVTSPAFKVPGTGGSTTNNAWTLESAVDPANTTFSAMFLYPDSPGAGRFYFGKSGAGFFALNFSNVTTLEGVPSFTTTDQFNHGYTSPAIVSHQIGRTGTTTFFQASGPAAKYLFTGGAAYTDSVTRMTLDATTGALTLAKDVWHLADDGTERLHFSSGATSYYKAPSGHAFRTGADVLRATIDATGLAVVGTGSFTGGIGSTTATTQAAGDSSTKVATTAFVTAADNLKANITDPQFLGIAFFSQPTPTAKNATATLTIAEIKTLIITATSAVAVSLTLPTGTLTDAGLAGGALAVNEAFEWYIINLGSASGAVTLLAGATHTLVGNAITAISTTSRWLTRKTAANTFVTYRIA